MILRFPKVGYAPRWHSPHHSLSDQMAISTAAPLPGSARCSTTLSLRDQQCAFWRFTIRLSILLVSTSGDNISAYGKTASGYEDHRTDGSLDAISAGICHRVCRRLLIANRVAVSKAQKPTATLKRSSKMAASALVQKASATGQMLDILLTLLVRRAVRWSRKPNCKSTTIPCI